MNKPVIIFGSKGVAKATLEIFNSNNIVVYGFLDDNKETHNTEVNGVPVLGTTDDHEFIKLIGQKCEAFVATDDNEVRKKYVEYLMKIRKVMPINAIHGATTISNSCSIGYGNFVNAGTIFSNNSKIGHHNIINSKAIIEQDVEIGDFVQVGAGTIINANSKIADKVFIGSGVTIVASVTIEKGVRIGLGSVVIENIKKGKTVFGNPAIEVKK